MSQIYSYRRVGRVAPPVTLYSAFAVISSFLIVITSASGYNMDSEVKRLHLSLSVLSLGCAALVVIGCVFCKTFVKRTYSTVQQSNEKAVLRIFVIFIWIFGLGVVLHEAVGIAISVRCLPEDDTSSSYGIGIAHGGLKAIFTFLELIIITTALHTWVHVTVKIKSAAYVVIICNLWIWLGSTLEDVTKPGGLPPQFWHRNYTPSEGNDACALNSTTIEFNSHLSKYLIPTQLEYFLLVTSFLLKTLSMDRSRVDCDTAYNNIQLIQLYRNFHHSTEKTNLPCQNRSVKEIILVIITTVINVIALITQWILDIEHVQFDPGTRRAVEILLRITEILSGIVNIVIIIRGFIFISNVSNTVKSRVSYTFLDYIYVISMIGTEVFAILGLLSSLQGRVDYLVGLKSFIFLISTLYQTLFLLQITRAGMLEILHCFRKDISYIFTVIGVHNFTLWIINVFLGLRTVPVVCSLSQGSELVDLKWWCIAREIVLYPCAIHFRFYSFVEMYFAFRNSRRR